MATRSTSEAGALLHEAADHQVTTDTPSVAAPSDAPPPSKRQRRSICTRSSTARVNCGECESNAPAPAAASFQTEPPPPPLHKEAHVPVFGPDACDGGVGLRLIDMSSLSKVLKHLGCRDCSREQIDNRMVSFFEFHNQKMSASKRSKIKRPRLEESYKQFKIDDLKTKCSSRSSSCLVPVSVESETVGFATTLHFRCKDSKHKVSVEPQKVSPDFVGGKCNKDTTISYIGSIT
eukprot:scaffold62688_cov40-Attheya_sp.AAC.1